MYTPLNQLADYVAINKRRLLFRNRWKSPTGQQTLEALLGTFPKGDVAAKQRVLDTAPPNFFEDGSDLRGLRYVGGSLSIADKEFFRNAVLNYTRFRDVTVHRSVFVSVTGDYTEIIRTQFEETTFVRASFFGAVFEDCVFKNCNFLDRNAFSNCVFKNVTFINCFFETDLFNDCSFDERTRVNKPLKAAHRFTYWHEPAKRYDERYSSSFYSGLREAYEVGQVSTFARKYLFREKQAFTRHNSKRADKFIRYFLEYSNGYGIKPLRVLFTAMLVFLLCGAGFAVKYGSEGFFLGAGGFFTFGASTDLLAHAGVFYHALYVFEAFLGIVNMSTFVVVLTNYWASLR